MELRRLKGDFDLAFSRLNRDASSTDPDYCAARKAYGLWRIAIDQFGVPLLDTIDALEARVGAPLHQAEDEGTRSSGSPLTSDQLAGLRAAFHDIDQFDEMVRLLDKE